MFLLTLKNQGDGRKLKLKWFSQGQTIYHSPPDIRPQIFWLLFNYPACILIFQFGRMGTFPPWTSPWTCICHILCWPRKNVQITHIFYCSLDLLLYDIFPATMVIRHLVDQSHKTIFSKHFTKLSNLCALSRHWKPFTSPSCYCFSLLNVKPLKHISSTK